MDENNDCIGLPSPPPNKRNQTGQSVARVNWIDGQGFERSGNLMASMVAACGTP